MRYPDNVPPDEPWPDGGEPDAALRRGLPGHLGPGPGGPARWPVPRGPHAHDRQTGDPQAHDPHACDPHANDPQTDDPHAYDALSHDPGDGYAHHEYGGPGRGVPGMPHGPGVPGMPHGPGAASRYGGPDDVPPPDAARRFPEQNAPGWVPAPPVNFAPASRPGVTPPSAESPALWEPWEPPSEPIGAIPDASSPRGPEPEFVRGQEYEDELSIWEASRPDGPGGPRHARRGPQRAPRPGRAGRPGRAAMVIAGVLAAAGAVPLSMLAVRTFDHHTQSSLAAAPLAQNQSAGAGHGQAGAAARFTATAGPGCNPVPAATTEPYQAPDGDGWHLGSSTASGPCGNAFAYSYLAMVPGNPGEWHDHYAWIFRTGLSSPSCRMSIYIPAAPQANSTVYYWFSAGSPNAVNRIADFTIDQATHQGQWISKGPFTFPGGTVLIEATDRGEGPPTAAAAVGPVRVTC